MEISHFLTIWVLVFPKTQLVLAETMRTQDLSLVTVPDERADLAVGVDGVDEFACLDVPESHGLVGSASSCG